MSFTIIEDKAQQAKKHEIKHQWFSVNNVNLLNMPLPVGDYILLTERVEDVLKRKEIDMLTVSLDTESIF